MFFLKKCERIFCTRFKVLDLILSNVNIMFTLYRNISKVDNYVQCTKFKEDNCTLYSVQNDLRKSICTLYKNKKRKLYFKEGLRYRTVQCTENEGSLQ